MKIGRFLPAKAGGPISTGVVLGSGADAKVLDLSRAGPALGGEGELDRIIADGRAGLDRALKLVERATREGEGTWQQPIGYVRWQVPIMPAAKCLCVGRNFGRHVAEAKDAWAARGGKSAASDFPTGFIKLSSSWLPDQGEVKRAEDVTTLDYEVEVGAIIGERIERVPEEKALDAVFGYTCFNDLSARQWQLAEQEHRLLIVGKNFPGSGPIGPWILTADEVPDPGKLEVRLRVNGETRQQASCSEMIHSFARIVSFWSRVILEPGDVVTSGTPEGVALARKPDPAPFYLKPGDVVEAEVVPIGTLTTYVR